MITILYLLSKYFANTWLLKLFSIHPVQQQQGPGGSKYSCHHHFFQYYLKHQITISETSLRILLCFLSGNTWGAGSWTPSTVQRISDGGFEASLSAEIVIDLVPYDHHSIILAVLSFLWHKKSQYPLGFHSINFFALEWPRF